MRETTIKSLYAKYCAETDHFVMGERYRSRKSVMRRAAFVNSVDGAVTLEVLAATIGKADHSSVINLRKKHSKYMTFQEYRRMLSIADEIIATRGNSDDIEYLKSYAKVLHSRLIELTLLIENIEEHERG